MACNPRFVGTWILVPEASRYELGQPPRAGVYRLTEEGGGYAVEMSWTAADGKAAALTYRGIPDGQRYPQEDRTFADEASMTDVSPRQLDSRAFKDGKLVLHATRTLSEDGNTMDVCQTGIAPDGSEYRNRSVYRRQVPA